MKITVISGSQRKDSESSKLAKIISRKFLEKLFEKIVFHDLSNLEVPYTDIGQWTDSDDEMWKRYKNKLWADQEKSDAFVIVCPEWAGMAPPKLKSYLMNSGEEQFGHKPALLITLSSGLNGSNPSAELRAFGTKNNKLLIIPDSVVIKKCEDYIREPDSHMANHRLEYSVNILFEYSKGMRNIRSNMKIPSPYPYGM